MPTCGPLPWVMMISLPCSMRPSSAWAAWATFSICSSGVLPRALPPRATTMRSGLPRGLDITASFLLVLLVTNIHQLTYFMQYTLPVQSINSDFDCLGERTIIGDKRISQGYRHSLTTLLKRFCTSLNRIPILPIWHVYSSLYKNLGEYAYLLLQWSDIRSARPRSSREAGLGTGPGVPVRRGTGHGHGAGANGLTGPGTVRPLEMQRKSRLAHQKRDFGYISRLPVNGDGHLGPAQRRRSHLGVRPTATVASPLKQSAPAEHLGGGAQIALFYKAQLSKTTPRYRGS